MKTQLLSLLLGCLMVPRAQAPEFHVIRIVLAPSYVESRLLHGVAVTEGWYAENSLARRHNNPGCLINKRGDYARFSDAETGWIRLRNWFQERPAETVRESLEAFNPGIEGYAERVLAVARLSGGERIR